MRQYALQRDKVGIVRSHLPRFFARCFGFKIQRMEKGLCEQAGLEGHKGTYAYIYSGDQHSPLQRGEFYIFCVTLRNSTELRYA